MILQWWHMIKSYAAAQFNAAQFNNLFFHEIELYYPTAHQIKNNNYVLLQLWHNPNIKIIIC